MATIPLRAIEDSDYYDEWMDRVLLGLEESEEVGIPTNLWPQNVPLIPGREEECLELMRRQTDIAESQLERAVEDLPRLNRETDVKVSAEQRQREKAKMSESLHDLELAREARLQEKELRLQENNRLRMLVICAIRQRGDCAECGEQLDPLDVHLDHVFPKAKGGADDLPNRQALCAPCNLKKSDRV